MILPLNIPKLLPDEGPGQRPEISGRRQTAGLLEFCQRLPGKTAEEQSLAARRPGAGLRGKTSS